MRRRHRAVSSYRLQFNRSFRFEDAGRLIPYLEQLGITECYASPLLTAVPGSEHGYDTCDHASLNAELGSETDFERLTTALASRGMGLIVDFVPNHMGLEARCNRWWCDVLRHGPDSAFANFFDIDWERPGPEPQGRILLPILEDGYGDVLERGEIRLTFDNGQFSIAYHERRLPLRPSTMASLLGGAGSHLGERPDGEAATQELQALQSTYGTMASGRIAGDDLAAGRERADEQLAQLFERSPAAREACEEVVRRFTGEPGNAASFDALDGLLDAQYYRLAHWKTSFDEINYRRFFDINNLGAIRMDNPKVFTAAHGKTLELIGRGQITGLRLDHTDGLLDPASYFVQLQQAIAGLPAAPSDDSTPERFHVVAEKILGRDELLPQEWQISGTTGYGFMNDVNGVFIDTANETAMRRLYARVTGGRDPFADVAYHSRRLVTASSMASELNALAHLLKAIAMGDRRTRDFTVTALRRVIAATVACMPVYRSYITERGFNATDREIVDHAIDRARRENPVMAQAGFLFLRRVLLSEPEGNSDRMHQARLRFAMRFQQFCAPVQAKGIEDTAFYRYHVLIALNEVGGDPARFGITVDAFHAGNRVRRERWRQEMTATATHDTKRGEDARARLCVLSEIPEDWRHGMARWRKINALRRTAVDRKPAPDPNDEYLFYQALAGSWPPEPSGAPVPSEASAEFVGRIKGFMQKAIKEAKIHTSWINPHRAYEDAVSYFVETTLRGAAAKPFLAAFVPLARTIAGAGMVNSLAQLVLKIASPGIPDFYQGTEGWQLDFADPDNRRPIDFGERAQMLDGLIPWIERSEAIASGAEPGETDALGEFVRDLVAGWQDARVKMYVTAIGLRLRRRLPSLFIDGAYIPLRVEGSGASHVVAFARALDNQLAVIVVPRLLHTLTTSRPDDPWDDTRVILPPDDSARQFAHVFTGRKIIEEAGALPVGALFRDLPAAILLPVRG